MHIKINITEMNPNILLHMLWSKKKPKEPINTPIALMDLAIHIYD
jgi:hypothetical protein